MILISGGFDPLHDGHLDLIEGARKKGKVIVALNSDEWLRRKKGYVFQPWSVRARILKALKNVEEVYAFDDSDDTVCRALEALRPKIFANGGDREHADPREAETCEALGIGQMFGVGGPKTTSSSALVRQAHDHRPHTV